MKRREERTTAEAETSRVEEMTGRSTKQHRYHPKKGCTATIKQPATSNTTARAEGGSNRAILNQSSKS